MTRIRVLVVDDHPVVRAGVIGMIAASDDFEVIGEATNGLEAVEQATTLKPDVIIMDLRMPELDGADAITRIRKTNPEQPILILTTYDTDADILKAVEAGATGYLLKDSPREDLYHAIRQTAEGQSALSPTVLSRMMGQLRDGNPDRLTPREVEVLEQVAQGNTNKAIGQALRISQATVKTHLIHIYDKLGVSDRASAVATAIALGFLRAE